MYKCLNCDAENASDSQFCKICATPFPLSKDIPVPHTKTLEIPVGELSSGSTLAGRYEIIEEIGKGGMGVVYKAKDTKLKRMVALKSISSFILIEKDVKIRFLREAQAAAALSHPNICTIYEIDDYREGSFLSMELIEGENLRDKAKQRPLPLEVALNISIQMSEGLRHAHERNIIHRDIKSANIMIKKNGQAKIMDFGLAKLADTTVLTKEGTTVGTIAYMSPEQGRGKSVDGRTDIWSLGVVMFEITAGQLPFQGDRSEAVVFSILNESPRPLTSLRSGIPLEFERIVNKCLEKDPAYRYQSSSDLLSDLKRLKRDLERGEVLTLGAVAAPYYRRKMQKWIYWATAALIPTVALIAAYFLFFKPSAPPILHLSQLRLSPVIGGNVSAFSPSWSPDGAWIAYASDEFGNLDIWKKPIGGGEAIQLTTSVYNESQPAWSPDGRIIAFFSDKEEGGIFLIPSEGGTSWRLTSFGAHPSWSPDSETLAFDWCGNIYLLSYTGGEPRLVVRGTSATPHTVWTSDGEKLIFWYRTKRDIYVFTLESEESEALGLVPTGQDVSGLTLSKDGRELVLSRGPFGGDKNLWRASIDPKTGKVVGSPLPLSVTTTEDIQCAFSPDGSKLAFTASKLERHLWVYRIDDVTGMTKGDPKRITIKSSLNYYPELSHDGKKLLWTSHLTNSGVLSTCELEKLEERKVTREWDQNVREIGGSFSPDGKQIIYSSTLGGSYEIWCLPSLGSIALQLTKTQDPNSDALPVWAPRGNTIAFYSNRDGNWDIWSVHAGGRGEPKRLTQWKSNENYPAWSPDGKYIAFRTDKEGNGDIWIMEADGKNQQPFITDSAEEGWSAWSPDGRWFYFVSNRSGGAFNIWIMPASGGEAHQVTTYKGISSGLSDFVLFTKFAVSSNHLIVPLETRKGKIYILENFKE